MSKDLIPTPDRREMNWISVFDRHPDTQSMVILIATCNNRRTYSFGKDELREAKWTVLVKDENLNYMHTDPHDVSEIFVEYWRNMGSLIEDIHFSSLKNERIQYTKKASSGFSLKKAFPCKK